MVEERDDDFIPRGGRRAPTRGLDEDFPNNNGDIPWYDMPYRVQTDPVKAAGFYACVRCQTCIPIGKKNSHL